MNKLFGKSKRAKEKEKRAEEQKEENDFLYGRSRSSARGLTSADSVSAMDNQRTTVGTIAEAEAPGSSLGERSSRGELKSEYAQSPGNKNEQNAEWGAPQATGGGKTSGMSQEEIDRLTKRRLKEERRKRGGAASMVDGSAKGSHARSQFEGHLSKSTVSPSTTGLSEEYDNRHHKSDRKHRDDEDNGVEERRRRHRERDEKDRKMKETIRQQRDAARDMRKSTKSHKEDDEKDRKTKKSSRKQREATKEIRYGATSHIHNEDDELEERRRRRRDQDEKDRKMKQQIREQRNAAKSMRSSSPADVDDELDRKMPHTQSRQVEENADAKNMDHKHNSFDNDPPSLKKEEEGGDNHQNLIDLHLAQFLKTASKMGDEGDEEYDNFPTGLNEFEEEEFRKNRERRMSRRISATTMKINAWQQKYSLKKAMQLAERTPEQEWASSFYRCDPRWQIMKFFDEVAREGGEAPMDENLAASPLANLFNKANVFTVWRPTSDEAIKNMMLGVATGKGLDIKGKSAKKGNISSYVPFIQIYEEPHKEHVHALIKDGRVIRVFYQTEECRNEAHEMLLDVKDFMLFAAEDAMRVLSDEFADEAEQQLAMKHLMYDDTNLALTFVDTYVNSSEPVFGLDITERLFWESYVMMQDCSRTPGTEWDIGRGSEPTFMDMNLKAIRHEPAPGARRAVVYQMSTTSPMEPRKLLMAYEEYGRVKPVVSDFDCFLLGSRGVKYREPVPPEQVELLQWSVKNISEVLDERAATMSTAGWMETWFKVLKKAAVKGYYPKTPEYGNADPKSYEIIKVAVDRLQKTGCVRHGAECFNWFFPQEIDDELLVVSDTLPGNVKWKKVNPKELQEILMKKIDEGFTFPLNPKWVLCDPGWRRVYDKLLASQKPNVQDSINCWLPPKSGLRAAIDEVSNRHPHGFEGTAEKTEGTEVMDQMEDDLEKYFKIQRAWRKLRLFLYWIRFVREKRREREEMEIAMLTRYSSERM